MAPDFGNRYAALIDLSPPRQGHRGAHGPWRLVRALQAAILRKETAMSMRRWYRIWRHSPRVVRAAIVGVGFYEIERRLHRH